MEKKIHKVLYAGQGSTKCGNLQSRIGEHGEHGEDEKHQSDELKHSIYDSK